MIKETRLCDCCGKSCKVPKIEKIPIGWHGLILTYKEKLSNGCQGGMFGRTLLCNDCSTPEMIDRISSQAETYMGSMLKDIKNNLIIRRKK